MTFSNNSIISASGWNKQNIYLIVAPQADHPLLVGTLLIEIWASIFCYL